MKREEYYSIAYIAVFGGAWGVSEVLLGNVLHLFNVPFRGLILSAIGSILCLTGGYLLPTKKGYPILFMGLLALLIKLSAFGVFKVNILVSIGIATLLIQCAVTALGYNILGFVAAGMGACLAPLVSTFLLFNVLYAQSWNIAYHQILQSSGSFIAGVINSAAIILAIIVILHIIIGIVSGLIAIFLGKKFSHAVRKF